MNEIKDKWENEIHVRYYPIWSKNHPTGGRADDMYFGEDGIYQLAQDDGFSLQEYYRSTIRNAITSSTTEDSKE